MTQSNQRCVADVAINALVACTAHDNSITFEKSDVRCPMSGINGPRPSSFKTRRPSTINKKAIAKRAQPESVMPIYFLRSHAVNGHAEMPENKANQPLVSGHGPRVMIRPKPPPPATMVHAQATKQPDVRPSFWSNVG